LRKHTLLFLLTIVIVGSNINADMMAELAKRDHKNPIRLIGASPYVLYAKDGYLQTEYRDDGQDVPSIVAYKIQEDAVTLIVRIKTLDVAYRDNDYFNEDWFTVDVHDYYLVGLAYTNNKLEIHCNRVKDINAGGFIFNEAEIGRNVNKVPSNYLTYTSLEKALTEGMKVKIAEMTNRRTCELQTYDYEYKILTGGKEVIINGYFLDFSDRIDYRIRQK